MNSHTPADDVILERALQLSGEQQAAYLQEVAQGDEQLLQRMKALLAVEPKARNFLQEPFDSDGVIEKPGDKIGRYKLLEKIGEGTFGIVFMAEEEQPVRRKLALKILKPGMDSREVVARFEAERQALALMNHPNIATVFDGGVTPSGRPFFAMELVLGVPITRYCDDQQMTTRQRLELFMVVCKAVQHAHNKGVIHRDLKPSNILVTEIDGREVPKVIDFGVAKASQQRLTEKTLFTSLGQIVGTLQYMSPEQAGLGGLDVDTSSDVYSLGSVLYELLTGRTTFNAKQLLKTGLEAVLNTIRERDPDKPSTHVTTLSPEERSVVASCRRADPKRLAPLMRRDLDSLVMKTLEKDRSRRYSTPSELAADIQRYLNNEPIVARSPTFLYRFQKMVRRNKILCAATGAVAVALFIGIVVSTWFFYQEKNARGLASGREQVAESQLARLTGRSAGWSQRARLRANAAAKMRPGANSGEARDQAAAALSGLDAWRMQQFTNFGASSVLFDQEGKRLLMGSLGDSTRLWDGGTNAPFGRQNPEPSPVAFAKENIPAELNYDSSRHSFSLSTLVNAQSLHNWNIPRQIVDRMKAGALPKLTTLTPDGAAAVTALELANGNEAVVALRSDSMATLMESTNTISSLTISTDGSLVAIASGERLEVWSLASDLRIAAFDTGRKEILCVALKSLARSTGWGLPGESENSEWVLAAGDTGGTVTIYNIESGEVVALCRGGHYQVSAVAFSPDGTTLASGGRGPVKLWDIATGTLLLDIPTGDYITGLDFAPDGSRLAISTQGITCPINVSVWSIDYGRGIRSLRGLSGQISKVCFSADGLRVAALSHNWEVGVWDVASGQLVRVTEVPAGMIADNAAIALDTSGECLAFSSWKKAGLWDIRSGTQLKTWDIPEGLADVMAFGGRDRLFLFRKETLDGRVDSGSQKHPSVCRIRQLLPSRAANPTIEIRDFDRGILDAATTLDGRCFIVEGIQAAEGGQRIQVKAFDSLTGRELWSIPLANKNEQALFTDNAGKYVILQTNIAKMALQITIASGTTFKELPFICCAICPETGLMVVPGYSQASERGCSLFFDKMETPAVALGIDQPAIALAKFDLTGNLLAWGGTDGTVTLCNLKEIKEQLARSNLQW